MRGHFWKPENFTFFSSNVVSSSPPHPRSPNLFFRGVALQSKVRYFRGLFAFILSRCWRAGIERLRKMVLVVVHVGAMGAIVVVVVVVVIVDLPNEFSGVGKDV